MKIAIIGPPGTGKSYLSVKMRERGYPAYDADSIVELGYWIDKKGKKVINHPEKVDFNWVKKHDFVWDIDYLTKFIITHKNIYFFGMSANAYNILHLFDKVYYLNLATKKIFKRLIDNQRTNYYGKEEKLRKSIIDSIPQQHKNAKKRDFVILDANLSENEIIEQILR